MAIAAAISILNEEGLANLSTRKVASEIGYTVGTLYLVFRNLNELLLHVNAATLDELRQAILNRANEHKEPEDQIRAMSFAYLDFARLHFSRWSLLYSHRLPEDITLPDWFDNKVKQLFALVEKPLKRMKPNMDELESVCATRVLWSGVHGACELALNDKLSLGGEISAEQLIDSVVNNYLAGLI